MSDASDDAPEEFDREAEREKLRKQLEAEEAKRESTQRMSDLLLKGATMTNRHCDRCGDPIFRHQDREFCPTCGREVGGGADEGDNAEAAADADADGADDGDHAEAAADADADADERDHAEADVDAEAGGGAAPRRTAEPADPDAGGETGGGTPGQSSTADPISGATGGPSPTAGTPSAAAPRTGTPAPAADGDLREARAALVRTLSALAHEAEAADDVRRVRDLLAAAREAAEAIAALDSAGR